MSTVYFVAILVVLLLSLYMIVATRDICMVRRLETPQQLLPAQRGDRAPLRPNLMNTIPPGRGQFDFDWTSRYQRLS